MEIWQRLKKIKANNASDIDDDNCSRTCGVVRLIAPNKYMESACDIDDDEQT